MKKILLAGLAAVVVAGIAVGAWLLLREEETTERGACNGVAYEFGTESDDGALEVSFELQSNAPGETWQVELLQDGEPLLEGERTTDDDGEIDIDAIGDEGAETFEVSAAPETGEPCSATLTR